MKLDLCVFTWFEISVDKMKNDEFHTCCAQFQNKALKPAYILVHTVSIFPLMEYPFEHSRRSFMLHITRQIEKTTYNIYLMYIFEDSIKRYHLLYVLHVPL